MDTSSVLWIVTPALWVLCAVSAFMPLSWAIPAYIMLAQLDITPMGFEGGAAVGFANVMKIMVVPTILYLRVRRDPVRGVLSLRFPQFWLLFVSYVAVASIWTDFRLPALKMIGFLYAYTLIFLVFFHSWRSGTLKTSVITAIAWVSMALAVTQSYLLGNPYGTPPGGSDYALQFTSFIDAQSFAPFLLILLIFQVLYGPKGWSRTALCGSLVIAILLAASRYVLVSTAMALLILSGGTAYLKGGWNGLQSLMKTGTTILIVTLVLAWAVGKYFPTSRVNEALSAVVNRGGSADDIVNLAWRLQMYQQVEYEVRTRGPRQLFAGAGTSSGTVLMNAINPLYDEDTADANRVVHNEYLRALYEWGILGCTLLILFVGSIFRAAVVDFLKIGSLPSLACLAAFPLIITGLGIENILSASGRPHGMGYALILSCYASAHVGTDDRRLAVSI